MNTPSPLRYSIHSRLREHHLRRLLPTPPPDGGRFLDVGCGMGYLTETLGEGWTRFGLDMDHHGLKANRARGLGAMVRGSAAALPFAGASFDLILCSEVLEHLPDPLDQTCLEEMGRLLKPGGRLLITVPSLEGVRATSRLRNLGHDDPSGGEYHHRMGYAWETMAGMIARIPALEVHRRRYAMFLISELFMDLLKWVYFRKHALKDHSDLMGVKNTPLFRIYRRLFPLLHALFVLEDHTLARLFRGHILILSLQRRESSGDRR